MKTIEESEKEIGEIINNCYSVEYKLQKLQATGYTVEYNWVKGGGIGHRFYLQRKRIYRIQISASELRGKYHMAWCVVIPAIVPATKTYHFYITRMKSSNCTCSLIFSA